MTKKQKERMLTLATSLMDIYKEAENDGEFNNFVANTFDGLINYSLDDLAMHVYFSTKKESYQ